MITTLKQFLKKTPIISYCVRACSVYKETQLFPGSKNYWESRYANSGNSGAGSYGEFATFKAEIINHFVRENAIDSVIEFGCGDSNQLSLFTFPNYIGLDVSPTALNLCVQRFQIDQHKSFFLYDPSCFLDHKGIFSADLALSLDVLYHLVEDEVYFTYLRHLFSSATKYVIIYSSDTNAQNKHLSPHCRLRAFTQDVATHFPQWHLIQKIQTPILTTPPVDFFIYKKL